MNEHPTLVTKLKEDDENKTTNFETGKHDCPNVLQRF